MFNGCYSIIYEVNLASSLNFTTHRISDEIHMDMCWGEHRHTPWCDVARGPWALFTSGSKSFNIPAFTGAYGLIDGVASREAYLTALKGRRRHNPSGHEFHGENKVHGYA